MSNKPNGGPAFPDKRRIIRAGYPTNDFDPVPGMTLRDYFAAHSIHAAVVKAIHNLKVDEVSYPVIDWDHIAESAFDAADAMIKARDQ